MKVLVIGGGAREHAICDAVFRSEGIELFSVMNNLNPGIQRLSKHFLLEKETNVEKIVDYALKKQIDLAIIGPEAPLEVGIVNELNKNKIKTCSPTKEAARIETDKQWMRNLLKKYKIPGQLKYETFTDLKKAKKFIEDLNNEVALKPIGLTGGKGVKVFGDHFTNTAEAMEYVKEVIEKKIGGKPKILIEEKAIGEEFTLQAFSDGNTVLPLHAVQDHKRLLPDDKGVNTGGMGSYSCVDGLLPFLTKSDYEEGAAILQKIIEALNKEGCKYIGPIYGQFMLTADGPKIIEINARFGDPEAMNVLPILESDFVEICNSMVEGNLSNKKLKIKKKSTVCKYVVPEGYGIKSMVGEKIFIDEKSIEATGSKLFYASVNKENDYVKTTSSRALAVVGISDTLANAEKMCEKALAFVKGDHIFIRHDIGTTELIQKRVKHME
ncbi:MAG: phosphoribosylamine--glycine ligase, partial [Candidatus Thermoplasmatota archaeon]|nr:phosphoribosylamine--glycine ligase [Candidatus Thermoplasmatota archaeon]